MSFLFPCQGDLQGRGEILLSRRGEAEGLWWREGGGQKGEEEKGRRKE